MTNILSKIVHNGDEYMLPRQKALVITLTSAWWSNNEQTVTATWVTANNSVIISPAPTYMSDYTDAKIYCSAQGTDSLTFTCDSTPASDIEVNVLVLSAEAWSTPTPWGWQPWANTLVYWEFNWNLDDSSGNNVTLTWTPYGYDTGIQWQALENTNNVQLDSSLTQWNIYSWAFAIAFCVNMQNSTTIQRIFAYGGSPSWSVDLQYEFYNDFSGFQVYTNGLSQRIAFPLTNPWIWVWKNIVVTWDGVNQIECYIDGVKTNPYSDYNTTFTYPSQNIAFSIRWSDGANNLLDGVIIENKYWTQSDVDLYLATYPVS